MKLAKPSIVYHCFFELSNVFAEMGKSYDNNSETLSKNKTKRDKLKNIFIAFQKIIRPQASEYRINTMNELFKSTISK